MKRIIVPILSFFVFLLCTGTGCEDLLLQSCTICKLVDRVDNEVMEKSERLCTPTDISVWKNANPQDADYKHECFTGPDNLEKAALDARENAEIDEVDESAKEANEELVSDEVDK